MYTIADSLRVEGDARSTSQGLFLGSFAAMPEPSEAHSGAIVFYDGPAGVYRPCSFYKCISKNDGLVWYWHPLVQSLDTLREDVDYSVKKDTTVNGHALSEDITLDIEDLNPFHGARRNELETQVDVVRRVLDVPTKVSQLSNDGVFITQDCSTMSNYWTKEQTERVLEPYTRLYVVDELPEGDAIDPHGLYSVPEGKGRKVKYRVEGEDGASAWFAI